MWSLTCVPVNVYNALYKFKPVFCCVQARHFWVFCWVLIALILDNGKGTLKELCQYLPPKLRYGTLMRMVRSGQWDADVLVSQMSRDVRHWLPAPADGIMRLRSPRRPLSATQHRGWDPKLRSFRDLGVSPGGVVCWGGRRHDQGRSCI
jgi:hypothetical protein